MEEKKESPVILPSGVTAAQIKAWKELHGENCIKLATIFRDENYSEPKDVVIHVPKRAEMDEFEKWIDRNPGKAKAILVNACLLTGKEEVNADPEGYFGSAFDAISKLIPQHRSILKNI